MTRRGAEIDSVAKIFCAVGVERAAFPAPPRDFVDADALGARTRERVDAIFET